MSGQSWSGQYCCAPVCFCRWLQAVPDVLGATVAAVSLLQGFCAFMLLCTAASVQKLAIRAVLCMQLIKLMCGSMALADGAGAVLCIFLLDETTVTAGLQRIRGVCTRRHTGTAAEGTVGPAGAELLSYKANGRHKRSHSADSLASLLTGMQDTLACQAAALNDALRMLLLLLRAFERNLLLSFWFLCRI